MDMHINSDYLIFDIIKAVTKDNRPFLKMILSDKEGSLSSAIMFDSNKLSFDPKKGDLVKISATLQYYNNQPQLKVLDMTFLSEKGSEAFLPKSDNDPAAMANELKQLFQKNLKNPWLVKLVIAFFNDKPTWEKFQMMPAAKNMHHAYIHGLLEHTLSIANLTIEICRHYPFVSQDLVLVGALFHDLGKINELATESGFDYSEEGKMLGHIVLGYSMVSNYIDNIEDFPGELKQEILHIIISHHGSLEFGSPQVPKTPEALLLNFIDDMDAKMNAVQSIFKKDNVDVGGWSNYDRLLERQFFRPR